MRRIFAATLLAASLAGCGGKAELRASDGVVRLPAVTGRPGAAYVTIHGGAQATTLLTISTPVAIRSEIHEMKQEGGMMTMAPVKDVAIPAGATVAFTTGGKHVMLYDIAPTVRPGATVPLKLNFADGRVVEVAAQVKAAGDAN